ncbi:unnamed protein product, partial [Mesorhabditis belari]|uniref:EF-hand domain-containing protein n=1 Tax=Mesorhabditis belari TaxID=2138241 RepID=A0AAF3EZH0_9BILA
MSSAIETIKETELREIFRDFDKNGDGRITCEELEMALLKLGEMPSNTKIGQLIQQADTDGNGVIDIDEFLSVWRRQMAEPNEQRELADVFSAFDVDGDGLISEDDLNQLFLSLGRPIQGIDLAQMLILADLDNDGQVDFQEFCTYMKQRS